MAEEQKFPTEVIDLPSEGKLYPKEHPCSNGKIEIKYMTAKEEDILTSQNLIKKGVVIDMVLNSLIVTKGVKCDDLILGDKNAVMIAARILAYGPEYECEVVDPTTGNKSTHKFNLAECPFRKLPAGVSTNEFEFKLPISKKKVKYRILTGKQEQEILGELKANNKLGQQVSRDITTRLRHTIVSVDGEDSPGFIAEFVNNMLARDSRAFRSQIKSISPDIEMEQEVEMGGETVKVNIPMTVNFFWPKS
jgi:hypothetical protein